MKVFKTVDVTELRELEKKLFDLELEREEVEDWLENCPYDRDEMINRLYEIDGDIDDTKVEIETWYFYYGE